MSRILPNSDGCIEKEPNAIQFLLPPMLTPKISGSTKITVVVSPST